MVETSFVRYRSFGTRSFSYNRIPGYKNVIQFGLSIVTLVTAMGYLSSMGSERKARQQKGFLKVSLVISSIIVIATISALFLIQNYKQNSDDYLYEGKIVGMNVETLQNSLHGYVFLIYDLSVPVLNSEATYDGSKSSGYVVISSCGATLETAKSPLAIGVIPQNLMTNEVKALANDGVYDVHLSECGNQKQ